MKKSSPKKLNLKIRKQQISKQNIFTIYKSDLDRLSITSSLMLNESTPDYFKSSIRSLNEHRLISDLTDMNLTKISHQMTSFNANNTHLVDYYTDNDSGFQTRSLSPSSNYESISLDDSDDDCISDMTCLSKHNLIANSFIFNKLSSSSASSLMYSSIPFVLKTSLNESFKTFKNSLLNSKFINFVRTKLVSRDLNRSLLDVTSEPSTSTSTTTTTTPCKSSKSNKSNNSSFIYNTGINSLRQFLLRIYDVNYF